MRTTGCGGSTPGNGWTPHATSSSRAKTGHLPDGPPSPMHAALPAWGSTPCSWPWDEVASRLPEHAWSNAGDAPMSTICGPPSTLASGRTGDLQAVAQRLDAAARAGAPRHGPRPGCSARTARRRRAAAAVPNLCGGAASRLRPAEGFDAPRASAPPAARWSRRGGCCAC